MKNTWLFALLVFFPGWLSAQRYSGFISADASAKGYLGFNFGFGDKNLLDIGFHYKSKGDIKEIVKERLPNYGQTKTGEGVITSFFDIGYTTRIMRSIYIGGPLGIGSKVNYISYSDNRFTKNGYSLKSNSESAFDLTLKSGFIFSNNMSFFFGFSTSKSFTFGLGYSFKSK